MMQARLITAIGLFLYLRRYRPGASYSKKPHSPCSVHPGEYGTHDAMVLIDQIDRLYRPITRHGLDWTNNEPDNGDYLALQDVARYKDDPRWPTHCGCGYAFEPDDEWQVFPRTRYDTATGKPETYDMYWADWFDPLHLQVFLPSGEIWDVDGPSSNGPGWTRTGEPPNITASPSILCPGYHGFLQGGVFTPDLDKGRTYERRVIESY